MSSLAALARSLHRYQSDGLAVHWDRATPKQLDFHSAQGNRRLLRAGNQTGKSISGAAESWAHAIGKHPFRSTPSVPNVGWVVAADLENHYPVLCRKLRETEPAWAISPETRYDVSTGYRTKGRRAIALTNGSLIEFRSGRGETIALSAASISWLWFDEPPNEAHFGEAISRVAVKSGPCWMTLTPVGRPCAWLRMLVEGDPDTGAPASQDWHQTVIQLTEEDCPHRSAASIQEQLSSYLPNEVGPRARGDWEGVTVNRLFSGWSDAALLEDGCLPPHELGIGLAWDHGEHAGAELCLLYAYDEGARAAWVLDEYASAGRTTVEQDAMAVLEMLDRNGLSVASVDRAHGDTNSGGKSALVSVNRMFEEAIAQCLGMSPLRPPFTIIGARKGPGSVQMGCRVLNNALLSGRLLVSSRCLHLVKGLRHWKGSKSRGSDSELAHAIDAARYGLVDILDPRARAAERLAVR